MKISTVEQKAALFEVTKELCNKMEKARDYLVERDLEPCWDIWKASFPEPTLYANDWPRNTIREITERLVRRGSLSDRQVFFLGELLVKVQENDKLMAEREVERAAAEPLPVPEGQENIRLTVSGEVLSVKDKGWGWKILVRADDGWKVWGSLPRAISDCKPGDFVRFDATIKASENDDKFGFFSRPTKATILHST